MAGTQEGPESHWTREIPQSSIKPFFLNPIQSICSSFLVFPVFFLTSQFVVFVFVFVFSLSFSKLYFFSPACKGRSRLLKVYHKTTENQRNLFHVVISFVGPMCCMLTTVVLFTTRGWLKQFLALGLALVKRFYLYNYMRIKYK